MRIFTATLGTETNTFSNLPTGRHAFEEFGIFNGRNAPLPNTPVTAAMHMWRELGDADGHAVAFSLATFAPPAGKTVKNVYENFRDEILADFRESGPYDGVLLNLHGAMVADGYDDCEGDLVSAIREASASELTIGVVLDPHCHLTNLLLENADIIITYKEYPHTDLLDRARELYSILTAAVRNEVRPVMAACDLPIVNTWATGVQPMRGFVDRMAELEREEGILSVSFAHGFPWGDVPPGNARTLVVSDGNRELARQTALNLACELWSMREQTAYRGISIDAAFDIMLAEDGLTVIADSADNTGGGAPGDSTFVLRRAIERGLRDVAIGPLWDPVSAGFCLEAGVGATLDLRIGGKAGSQSGLPVDATVIVRGVSDDLRQILPFGNEQHVSMGPSAWVEIDGIDVVLVSVRMQGFSPDLFENVGIDMSKLKAVVVKSTNHFREFFDPISTRTLYLIGPGALNEDYRLLHYENRSNRFWPREELDDPLQCESEPSPSN